MGKRKDHVCHRCGKCCIDNGTIWVHSKHPVIAAMVKAIVDRPEERILRKSCDKIRPVNGIFRDGGPCDMLIMNESGQAVCLIQKWLGHKYKPPSCQDYPFAEFDDGRCHREIEKDNARLFGEADTTPSLSVAGLTEDED